MSSPVEAKTLSTDKILLAASRMAARLHRNYPADHLDIGSGSGALIALMNGQSDLRSQACDYTDELIEDKRVPLRIANLNTDPLPYPDASFDIVTCTEVVEHLENYRATLREMYRVLRPGGTAVITTPNILNLKSRIRYLVFGFFSLFGPLHFRESRLYSTGGHITPIGLYYLNHALIDAGFDAPVASIDKRQGTSWIWYWPLILPIQLFAKLTLNKEIAKYKTVDEHNVAYVHQMNTRDILLGRTIIVGAKKPAPPRL